MDRSERTGNGKGMEMAEELDRDVCHLDREELREGQLETNGTAEQGSGDNR